MALEAMDLKKGSKRRLPSQKGKLFVAALMAALMAALEIMLSSLMTRHDEVCTAVPDHDSRVLTTAPLYARTHARTHACTYARLPWRPSPCMGGYTDVP